MAMFGLLNDLASREPVARKWVHGLIQIANAFCAVFVV